MPIWALFFGLVLSRDLVNLQSVISVALGFGGLALGTGYFWALLRRVERPVSRDLIDFHRREQMQRLKKVFTGSSLPSAETLQRSVEPQVGPRAAK